MLLRAVVLRVEYAAGRRTRPVPRGAEL